MCRYSLMSSLNPKPRYSSTLPQVRGDFFCCCYWNPWISTWWPSSDFIIGALHFGITAYLKQFSYVPLLATAPSFTYLNWPDSYPDSPCMRWPARTLPASRSAMSTLSSPNGPREWASGFFLSILWHFRILWMLFLRKEELHEWVIW